MWSGLGGALGFPAARQCNLNNPQLRQSGWSLKPLPGSAGDVALGAPGGGCLKVQGAGFAGGAGGLIIADCNTTDPAQTFTYDDSTFQVHIVAMFTMFLLVCIQNRSKMQRNLIHWSSLLGTSS